MIGLGVGLEARAASVVLGGRPVLAGISIALRPGELVAVVGRNGAGKSTLLRLLAGLLRPSAGEVRLDGRPLAMLAAGERARRLGFLAPAGLPIPIGFTVREVVGWARFAQHGWWRSTGVDDPAVERALAALDLAAFAERRIEALSDGERARVWLAGLVAQETDYVLLDEPTSHLDAAHALRSLATIRRWVTAGRGVAVVLHDIDAALAVADRVVLVDSGRIALDRPVLELAIPQLEHSFGVDLAEVVLDGRRRLLARGFGGR